MAENDLQTTLRGIVGDAHVLADPALRAGYEQDVTGRYGGEAALVVRPADTAQVAAVVAACADAGTAIVPQGGNTGLAGGGVPRGGEAVLSLARLDSIGEPSSGAAQIVVGAGATLAALQETLLPTPFEFAVDHGARSAATLGGMAATNAGGAQVFRFGAMRAQVIGFEAVLADGAVVRRMSGLMKDNSGYELGALLVGSEGTLAVLTALTLRLVPRRRRRLTGLVAVRGMDDAVTLMARLRAAVPTLVACELLLPDGIALVCAHRRWPAPFVLPDDAVCLLVECADDEDPGEQLLAALEDAPPLLGEAFADDTAGRERLWRYREAHNEAVAAAGVPHKFDVTVLQDRIAPFLAETRAAIAADFPDARVYVYGHLGDGNLHVNVVGVPSADRTLDALVLGIVAAYDGSISAEHGVGQSRRDYLGLVRSDADLAAMRGIKRALDPRGLLNPGKLLPQEARARAFTLRNLKADLEDLGSNFDGAPDLEFRLATKALGLERSGLGYQHVPPGYRFPYGHTHERQEEVYVVVGGSGRMKLDDEIVALKQWDVVRVPPGMWRGYEAGPEGLEILVIGAPNLGENPRGDVEGRRDWWAD